MWLCKQNDCRTLDHYRAGFGIYIHVPFCERRCPYCAFFSTDNRPQDFPTYLDALRHEIEAAAIDRTATSVFFGGGTPSFLTQQAIEDVLRRLPLATDAEITLECNPEHSGFEQLKGFREAGVNRLSLGMQSTDDAVLQHFGRQHTGEALAEVVHNAHDAGFRRVSVDLVYGSVAETAESWRKTLQDVVALVPRIEHVSAYALTIEPETVFATKPELHPSDDRQAEAYEQAEAAFCAAGLQNYEISNWAIPGAECRHNLLYWAQGDYLGFGPAAHSHRAGHRWWSASDLDRYLQHPGTRAGEEHLEPQDQVFEQAELALRTRWGVPQRYFSAEDREAFAACFEQRGESLVLTPKGRLLANDLACRMRVEPMGRVE